MIWSVWEPQTITFVISLYCLERLHYEERALPPLSSVWMSGFKWASYDWGTVRKRSPICRTLYHTKYCHSRGVILFHGRDSHLRKQNSIKLPFNYSEQFAKFHLAPDSCYIVQPTMHSRLSALAGSWGVEIVIQAGVVCLFSGVY